ncbi:hypothetical protein MCELHM10_02942 [Paracoccaceae bacterium]|jgi:hypothetical protein
MSSRVLAFLAAAAMLASLFLSWTASALGQSLIPWEWVQSLGQDQARLMLENAPPEVLVFLASFALAAVFLLMTLIGRESKFLALLTGAGPVGLVAWGIWSTASQIDFAGVPVSSGDLGDLLAQATDLLGPGAWAWIGGAAVLLLLGLLDPGRRRG